MSEFLEKRERAYLVLQDGTVFLGFAFGALRDTTGEVVFNTGMVGYPESFTDPSYSGEILALTYPLIGNYGVPPTLTENEAIEQNFESSRVHIAGLVVSEYSEYHHHWQAAHGLSDWLREQNVPGISGVDTRALTKKLRATGTMPGRIVRELPADAQVDFSVRHYVPEVSVAKPVVYGSGKHRVALVDCGCKNTIIHSLLARDTTVTVVPWNFDPTVLDVDGVLFSNGPGDPLQSQATIDNARRVLERGLPTFGICLGHQMMALASGAKSFKLKFGHRSQNQPCRMVGTKRCFITSQNHGYAIDPSTLSDEWEPWFENVNDGTNEGIRHRSKPFMSVQFHPEAKPGPVDTGFLFDEFVSMLK